ncbi:MAG TPA: TetR/AcrR family transcriptional regulator [Syntrophomonadaceae bacterium]|nr:TetR/AcrR family transcriptional regulator [Syntrophomonadaceae bacterium]
MENKKSKREVILQAATKVFSTKGYHNTRMDEIAIEAEIGKSTIYEYFNSKLQLFQEMMEASFQIYAQKMMKNRTEDLSFEEKFLLLIEGHIQFCKENKELTRIVFWDTEIIDEDLKEWSYVMRKIRQDKMFEIVQTAIDQGELKPIDPKLFTFIMTGIIASLWTPITLEDWDVDAGQLAVEITDIIMNGIKA